MKRSIVFAVPDFLPFLEVAQEAEAAGFDRIWTTEDPGRDAIVRALTIALSTRSIGIGTGIAYAFTRSPLALAATAADVALASGGRFTLGLGAGTQGMRTRWYGITEFDHAASRVEEYAEILRKAWAAERSYSHEGRFYTGSYGELNGVRPRVPIWGSGINATMLRIAARSCDGVAVHPLGAHLRYLDAVVLPAMAEGAAAAGRPAELALWRMTAVDEHGDRARGRARRSLAFYFSTPSYAAPADETGWGAVAGAIRDMYRERGSDWDAISALVPDEMVAEFCLAGTPDEVLADWRKVEAEYAARGVSETVFQTVGAGPPGEENIANLRSIVAVLGRVPDMPPASERGTAPLEDFRTIGRRVSNWGRWGVDDERGTLNLITPDCLVAAARLVRTGKTFALGIPFDGDGPQDGRVRGNPTRLMKETGAGMAGHPGAFRFADDYVFMALQAASQWDSLAHVHYDGQLYNGFPASSVDVTGAAHCSVSNLSPGVVGRGVLLDVARQRGVDWLAAGTAITPEELDEVATSQGIEPRQGDVLLVRTGWRRKFVTDGDKAGFKAGEPGLSVRCADWLNRHGIAAVGSDNFAVEVLPGEYADEYLPLHMIALRDMGMPLAEILDLEALGEDCARDGVYDFLFVGSPLSFTRGVGSPVNPLALK